GVARVEQKRAARVVERTFALAGGPQVVRQGAVVLRLEWLERHGLLEQRARRREAARPALRFRQPAQPAPQPGAIATAAVAASISAAESPRAWCTSASWS